MTRDEAEEIIIAVEVGLGGRYGITRGQYAEAMLQVAEPLGQVPSFTCPNTEDIRNVGSICGCNGVIQPY